jgi:hypothetical protein
MATAGEIIKGALRLIGQLAEGEIPTTAILQVPAKLPRSEVTRAMDGIRAARRTDGRSAFDVTFSPSKSVSLLWSSQRCSIAMAAR